MNHIELQELDWIIVTDPLEEVSMDMEVVDYMQQKENAYILAIPAYEEDEEDEEEQDDAAYIFKLCEKEQAEFIVTVEHSEIVFGVTTEMTEAEFKTIAEIFSSSENYDLEVEENDDDNK